MQTATANGTRKVALRRNGGRSWDMLEESRPQEKPSALRQHAVPDAYTDFPADHNAVV